MYTVLAECHGASTCLHWRTYMLPVQNVRLSPNLSLVERNICQTTGSGRMSMQRSVKMFGKVEYRCKAFWFMQRAPRMEGSQSAFNGIHVTEVAVMFAVRLATRMPEMM